MVNQPSGEAISERFYGIEQVVADPLRFKLRLGIGEDAYASLRIKKKLQEVWDVSGFAASGAAAAASPIAASTFFASTASGGILGMLGLGTAAATPVGWVAAAALASGGLYFGVTRMMGGFAGSRVDTIPKFINTPLDLLAASLLDLIGGLAARVSIIDGQIDPAERHEIERHFISDWGLDAAYVTRAMEVIFENAGNIRVKDLATSLAFFQLENPDCNPESMRVELMSFLTDVATADGVLDEREELALEAIEHTLRAETELSIKRAGLKLKDWGKSASKTVNDIVSNMPTLRKKRT